MVKWILALPVVLAERRPVGEGYAVRLSSVLHAVDPLELAHTGGHVDVHVRVVEQASLNFVTLPALSHYHQSYYYLTVDSCFIPQSMVSV